MSRATRILVVVASLTLLLTYAYPLWTITLEASHLPERLGMEIRVDDIVGREPGHIEEINHLNHYVGMKPVEPEAIPELRVIPWIVGFLSLFGLVTAALGRRDLLYVWVATVLVVGLVGLADFWWWEYRYGHDLDEQEAIFRVPGMSFQPPLLGKKKILNFTVWSWPGMGGGAAMGAGVLAMVAAARELLRNRREPPHEAGTTYKGASNEDR